MDFASGREGKTTELLAYREGEAYMVTWDLWGGRKDDGYTTPVLGKNVTNIDGIIYTANTAYDVVTSSIIFKQSYDTGFTTNPSRVGKLPELKREDYTFGGWFANKGPWFTEAGWNLNDQSYR